MRSCGIVVFGITVAVAGLFAAACSDENVPSSIGGNGSSSSSSSSSSGGAKVDAGDAGDSSDSEAGAGRDASLDADASPEPYVPEPSRCNPQLALGGTSTKVAGDVATERLAGITRDELTIAWIVPTGLGASLFVADRADTTAPFGTAQAIAGSFAQDGVALSGDGLSVVAIGQDHKSFVAFERADRASTFVSANVDAFTSLVSALDPTEQLGDPVFVYGQTTLLYSVYGKSLDTVRLATRIGVGSSFFPSTTFTFTELRQQGSKRRRPTGTGDDFQTIFFWDEVSNTEKLLRLNGTAEVLSLHDLGAHPWAHPNQACNRVYFGEGDLFVTTAQ